jgi:SAM-dependent methyltransferase
VEPLARLLRTARSALSISRRVGEEEFKRWRRLHADDLVRSGRCYVPMPGLESTRHYRDKQNLHHLGRYEWARRVVASSGTRAGRVLDCACGVGYGTALLAGVAGSVDGADVHAEAVAVARTRYHRPNVRWHVLDAADLLQRFEPESFDVVTSFQTIECVDDDEAFLAALRALLVPGGTLLIDTPLRNVRDDAPRAPFHRRHYAVAEWPELLGRHFPSVQVGNALPGLRQLERFAMPGGGSLARCVKGARAP